MPSANPHIFQYEKPFRLESGAEVPGFHLAYTTLGTLRADGSNVVWIFHALTANSNPAEWWPGLVGEAKLFDPSACFIVCVNMPGSCYGSIGPLSEKPGAGKPWYHDFPFFTPRDMARAYRLLQQELGIHRIHVGIGGSMGGQQLLEWAIEDPDLFGHIVPIATNAVHSAWGRAFNASQRMCIEADASWPSEDPEAGRKGMEAARSVALLSYRHYHTYAATQVDAEEALEDFRSESYQRYQGLKLARRFNAFSYHALSKGMDSHNVGRGRGGAAAALSRIRARTLVIAVDSDLLFPPAEQAFIAGHVPEARLETIHSLYGHDGFLLEFDKIGSIIRAFLTPNQQSPENNL
jgi:homoserine O-acetyltransferase/O-succinyltransferase